MKVRAEIKTSKQFDFNGSKFVTLEGFINGLGIFKQTVKENLVPDSLEGKECEIEFTLGLNNFKPCLKVVSINLIDNI